MCMTRWHMCMTVWHDDVTWQDDIWSIVEVMSQYPSLITYRMDDRSGEVEGRGGDQCGLNVLMIYRYYPCVIVLGLWDDRDRTRRGMGIVKRRIVGVGGNDRDHHGVERKRWNIWGKRRDRRGRGQGGFDFCGEGEG